MNDATVDGGSMHKVGHGATRWFWLARMRRRTSPASEASFAGKGAGMTAQDQDGRFEEKNMHKSGESSWVATFCAVALGTLAWAASATAAVRPAANAASGAIGNSVHVVETGLDYPDINAALADAATRDGQTLELAPGIYSGSIVLTKSVHLKAAVDGVGVRGGNFHLNAGPTVPPSVIIDGLNVNAVGVQIASGVTGASVSGLEVRNFTSHCVEAVGGNHNTLIEENFLHHCGQHGVLVSGGAPSGINGVTIRNNEITDIGFGPNGGRGIVVWDGIKRDITIQNNFVHDLVSCCGIELQDGAATGAWILDNVVENVGDSGMSFIQLTSGSPSLRANIVRNNTITNTGRFGIEIKIPNGSGALPGPGDSGDGAILVEGNTIDGAGVKTLRDRAGIAVIRRAFGVYSYQVDATAGVVVRNNTVHDVRTDNPGSSYRGYGIVVEGLASSITGNTLTGNDIGLQVQQANQPSSLPGDSNQNTVSAWFARGNAPFTCVTYSGNTASGNTLGDTVSLQPAGASMSGGYATNQNTGATYCTITSAVAAASNGDTIAVATGLHAENVVVARPITIVGAGQASTTIVPAAYNPDCGGAPLGSQGSMCTAGDASVVFLVKASNVEISDLTVDGINPNIPGHATDIAARNGIMSATTGGAFTNFKVHDTTIRNIWLRGLYSPSNNGSFEFRDNVVDNVKSDPYASLAIFNFGGGGIIDGNTVSNANDGIAANWSRGTTFSNNTVTGSGGGVHTDNNGGSGGVGDVIEFNTIACNVDDGYGIFSFANYRDVTIQDNTISACAVGLGAFSGRTDDASPLFTTHFLRNQVDGTGATVSTPGDTTAGAWLSTTSFNWGHHDNQAELANNRFTGFDVGVITDRGSGKSLNTTANVNRISGNATGWSDNGDAVNGSNGSSDFSNNWWGCNADPAAPSAGCDAAQGVGASSPWLVLSLPASPINIAKGATISIAADLNHNSAGTAVDTSNLFTDGTSIAFAASNGASATSPQATTGGVATTSFSGLLAGSSTVTASFENAAPTVLVQITPAAISLDGPLTRTYDGSAQVVTATTSPANLPYSVIYDGSPTPPTAAGSYTVVATITDNCCEGTVTGTLVINRANTTIEFVPDPASFVYDGNTHAVTARLLAEPGMPCSVGGTVGPNVGSYPLSAAACTGSNYQAPASSTSASVTPQPTTISFSHLVQAFDGSPKSVVATTVPTPNVALTITYNGSPTPPTAVGSYAVVATVADGNYSGSNAATLQIVPGTSDMALVLNGPVDPIHVGDTAQYAATMLANPALHTGEHFGYRVELTKSGGAPLALSDLATMEVFYNGVWEDATTFFGSIPFVLDPITHVLTYNFPDGIPGYSSGFPILDPSWTWNVRFSFATVGTYTVTATLTDGIAGPDISPAVVGSIATVVLPELPPTDIHMALTGPVGSIEVGSVAGYTGTMTADPSLHVGDKFDVRTTIAKTGGNHPLAAADLASIEVFYMGSWQALPPGAFTLVGNELVMDFPNSLIGDGFEIQDPVWTWNFRASWADTGVYTMTAQVIDHAQVMLANPDVFATGAISTTVVAATPHLPDMALLLNGPLDPVELGSAAQYTGTMLAEPSLYTGHTFFVRVRLSKNGGVDAMTAADLVKMELYNGGWFDATSQLQPELHVDGNDLVYLFPQPNAAFPIIDPVWSWNFRFTYGSVGVYGAQADVIDAADAGTIGDAIAAPSLAHAQIDTTVIDTPQISLQLQGAVVGTVGTPVQYVGTLRADPLPNPANLYFVQVRLHKSTGPAAVSDISKMEIFWGGQWVDPTQPPYNLSLPFTQDGGDLVYLFPKPIMDNGFPIDEAEWSWQFRFTFADAAVYTATATVVDAGALTAVADPVSIQTDIGPMPDDIRLDLNGPVAGVEEDVPAAYTGRLRNFGGALAENGYVKVRIEMSGETLLVGDVDAEVWDGSAWVAGSLTAVNDGLEVDFPDTAGFPIPAGFDYTHQFRITYHRTGVFHALAAVMGAVSGDVHASAEMFTEVVARSPVTASVSFDPNSLHAVYDGAAHAALASTSPSGLTLVYTYNGNNTAPTQAGSYVVVATIDAGNPANAPYVGSASAILTIDKATGTVGFAPLTGAYGSVHAVTATLSPVDANSTCSAVAGVPAQNAAVGVYSVSASCTSDNYAASGTASYAVTPAAAGNTGITLTGGSFVYDGASHAATVANPNAVAYALSYDTGNGSAPINAGNWTATLTVTDPNYTSETLTAPVTITQADVSLVFGDLAHVYDGTPKAASVATVPAGVTGVSLGYAPDAMPINAGSYLVTATLSNPNYSLTGTTTATLTIAKAVGAVSFGATNFSFDGLPHDTTAVIAQETGTSCTLTPVGDYPRTHAGSTTLAASCDGQNYTASGSTTLTVSPKAVTIALSGLGTFSYDGNAHAASASVTGEVAGFPATTVITYNGSGTAPSDTGSYNVVAALDAGVTDYTAMPVNGLIVIGAANATVTLSDLSAVYDGNPHAATVVTDPAGLTTSVTYDGSATPPTNAGSYTVVATITQAGYSGSASGTLVIAKAPATVTLNAADLLQTWGSTHAVGVTTDPASLATSITYDGNAGEPANVGSYSVVAVVTDPNYTGSASGTLVITHGDPAQISVVGSAMFSGTAGQPLVGPLPTVKVTDAGGNPVPGVAITFAAGAGDGSLSGATPSTDQNGLALLGGWTLDAAPGTDVVTATAAGVGGNVTFSATSTADSSGLAVSVTDGRVATQVGRVLTWTIMIGNGGNSNLDGVHVEDALPVEMDANGALWQCIAINGATCAASGSGDLDEMIDLPAGSSVVYLLSATVVQDVDGMIENMVSVTHGGNTIVRTDQTEIVIFRDGFEMYGDGSSPRPEGMQPIALGTLGDDQPLMFAIEPQQLPSLQRVSIAQASDRGFTVEAIRIDGVAYLRLIARGDAGEVTTEWSVVAGTQFALLLDGTRLALVGAAADLDLELAHGGSIAVNGAGPM